MNGIFVLVFAATVFGAAYYLPRAFRYDAWIREMENLDDDELAAVLKEFPDYLTGPKR
jgi:hypothetical protein